MCAKRCEGWRSFCSSCATFWPVSTAVELATARIKAFRLGCLRLSTVVLIMVLLRVVNGSILQKLNKKVSV